jgi:Fe-S cluster biosynthesis and repair protein YggX
MIYCVKLKKEAPGLEHMPYPGGLGQTIFDSISAEAWKMWLAQQTILINEYRLNLLDPNSRKLLTDEMKKFLFENTAN